MIPGMARVYLETSFISALVTTRTDVASMYRRDASREWMESQSRRHELFASLEVINELDRPAFRQRAEALDIVRQLPLLTIDDAVVGFAELLIREHVMPGPLSGDALHVAASCLHRMDYLLSWNVRHLANANKLQHLQTICLRVAVFAPRIVTPDLLWETNR